MSLYCKYCGSDETERVAEESFADEIGVDEWIGCYSCGRMYPAGGC